MRNQTLAVRALAGAVGSLLALAATSAVAEDQVCFCASPDGATCRNACSEPPKEEVKVIKVSRAPGVGGLARFPELPMPPSGAGPARNAADKALENPRVRDKVKREIDERFRAVSESPRGIDKAEAGKYEKWGAVLGAAEAREKVSKQLQGREK